MSLLCKVVAVKAEDQTIKKTKYIKVLTLFCSCDEVIAELNNNNNNKNNNNNNIYLCHTNSTIQFSNAPIIL